MADDHASKSLLGNGYRLDLVSVLGMAVLRREEGTEVARFSVCDATSKAIEEAARLDQQTRRGAETKTST